ncbi:MAG: DUF1028 domain-containing protein [Dermatophilaceae bacterium]
MTFSVVARDGDAWGVAVASRFLAVGSLVPAVRSGIGAVASQAMARVAYLGELLDALDAGVGAQPALDRAVDADEGREHRQVGVVGVDDAATFTGARCLPWAGGARGGDAGTSWAIQGNVLTGPEVVEAMVAAWHDGSGAALDARLLRVLLAGDAAGGDSRGRQSAALVVRAPDAGYDRCGVVADLRVDDHPDAPRELERLHDLSTLYFGTAEGVRPLVGGLRHEVGRLLAALGHDGETEAALDRWTAVANLENRRVRGGIDSRVLDHLRSATP